MPFNTFSLVNPLNCSSPLTSKGLFRFGADLFEGGEAGSPHSRGCALLLHHTRRHHYVRFPVPCDAKISQWVWCCQPAPFTTRGDPKAPEFICKNCVFILTCLNFSHLQSTLHLMQYTYRNIFSSAQNCFWTHWFWCFLVLLLFFCFTSFTSAKHFPLRTFFIWRNKKSLLGRDQVNREGGTRGSCHFSSKTAEPSLPCGQMCYHEMGKCVERVLKKYTEAKCSLSQRQLVHWYRWVPRTLT